MDSWTVTNAENPSDTYPLVRVGIEMENESDNGFPAVR